MHGDVLTRAMADMDSPSELLFLACEELTNMLRPGKELA